MFSSRIIASFATLLLCGCEAAATDDAVTSSDALVEKKAATIDARVDIVGSAAVDGDDIYLLRVDAVERYDVEGNLRERRPLPKSHFYGSVVVDGSRVIVTRDVPAAFGSEGYALAFNRDLTPSAVDLSLTTIKGSPALVQCGKNLFAVGYDNKKHVYAVLATEVRELATHLLETDVRCAGDELWTWNRYHNPPAAHRFGAGVRLPDSVVSVDRPFVAFGTSQGSAAPYVAGLPAGQKFDGLGDVGTDFYFLYGASVYRRTQLGVTEKVVELAGAASGFLFKRLGDGFAIGTEQSNGSRSFFIVDPTAKQAIDLAKQGAGMWPTHRSETELRDGRLAYIANAKLLTVDLSGKLVEHTVKFDAYGPTGMSLHATSKGLVGTNVRAFFVDLQ